MCNQFRSKSCNEPTCVIFLSTALVTATTSDNTAVIVGGVVGVVALVVTGIIVVSVLVLRYWSRNRQAEYSIKQNESYE